MRSYAQLKQDIRSGRFIQLQDLLEMPAIRFRMLHALLKKHEYAYSFDTMEWIKIKNEEKLPKCKQPKQA